LAIIVWKNCFESNSNHIVRVVIIIVVVLKFTTIFTITLL